MAYVKNGSPCYSRTVNAIIKEKMKVLEDFGICVRYDQAVRKQLEKAIEDSPGFMPK